ncbi:MAG: carbon-nitrogen hydrolase family protein [Pirellulaceae bacterium]
MAEPIRIAGVQMDIKLAKPDENLARMEQMLEQTAAEGARLTIFPECALTGYCFESLAEARPYAEPAPGPSIERMAGVCRRLGMHVVFGMLEQDGERMFNTCALVGPEGLVGTYRKIHLPYLGIDMFTTPGDRPFAVHQAGELRIGMHICYDGAFPEAARVMALAGADLIVLPTNWPPGGRCTAQFVTNCRAMENHVYYAAVDRVGVEREFSFIGHSRICEPSGAAIADAAHDRPAILYADLDVDIPRNKHLVRVPGKHEIDRFADRRPEMYGPIVAPVVRE